MSDSDIPIHLRKERHGCCKNDIISGDFYYIGELNKKIKIYSTIKELWKIYHYIHLIK